MNEFYSSLDFIFSLKVVYYNAQRKGVALGLTNQDH